MHDIYTLTVIANTYVVDQDVAKGESFIVESTRQTDKLVDDSRHADLDSAINEAMSHIMGNMNDEERLIDEYKLNYIHEAYASEDDYENGGEVTETMIRFSRCDGAELSEVEKHTIHTKTDA